MNSLFWLVASNRYMCGLECSTFYKNTCHFVYLKAYTSLFFYVSVYQLKVFMAIYESLQWLLKIAERNWWFWCKIVEYLFTFIKRIFNFQLIIILRYWVWIIITLNNYSSGKILKENQSFYWTYHENINLMLSIYNSKQLFYVWIL